MDKNIYRKIYSATMLKLNIYQIKSSQELAID